MANSADAKNRAAKALPAGSSTFIRLLPKAVLDYFEFAGETLGLGREPVSLF